ncbi:hypothetical protein ACOYSL_005371, partial [Escherichia coli]
SGDQYLLNTSEQTGTISTRERLDHKNHLYGLENFSFVPFQGFCVGTNTIESGYSRSCTRISKLM